jgi:predicted aminopeptidase
MAGAGLIATVSIAAACVCLGSGCSTIGYYAQSVSGHVALMRAAKPVSEWEEAASTAPALKERLALSQRIRDYATSELKLPDNGSYRRYADLGRSAAVWNVVAAPDLSLALKTWCFPIVGCVGYRGYYKQADADAEGQLLREQGLEVSVYGVPAYSTLGWMNWAGGDPLLSTFIRYPEGELARLIFHELAHQVAYAAGDTTFNESFAVSVERIGGERWLTTQSSQQARDEYALYDSRRSDFRTLTMRYREQLELVYASSDNSAIKRLKKEEVMTLLRADYATMKTERWAGYSGYDGWFANANNASFGVLAAYNELVPQFERLFEHEGRDFPRFYAEVKRLAAMPKDERRAALAAY